MSKNTVFSQILQLICQYQFKKYVTWYKENKYIKRFSTWQQLIVHLFAQAKRLDSLRDIQNSTEMNARSSI